MEAEMNWFQRHLNWTWVLALVPVLGLPALWVVRTETVGGLEAALLGLAMLVVSNFVITDKGRSRWWLLLSGVLSPLWLKNKTTA